MHVQPLPEQQANIAVVMEHVRRPARSMNAPVLNVSAMLDGLGTNAKIVRKWCIYIHIYRYNCFNSYINCDKITSRFWYLVSGKYGKIAKGTYCSGSFTEITNEAECQTAAKNLGLRYFATINYKDGWFPACFALEKIVRFNKHSSPNRPTCGDLSFCRQVAAICKGIKQWRVAYFTIFWLRQEKYLFVIIYLCYVIAVWRLTTTLTHSLMTSLCLMDKEYKFCFLNNSIDQKNNGETVEIVKKCSICYPKTLPL